MTMKNMRNKLILVVTTNETIPNDIQNINLHGVYEYMLLKRYAKYSYRGRENYIRIAYAT